MARRGGDLRLPSHGDVERGASVVFFYDDATVTGYLGESVAAALLAAGHRTFRITSRRGEPRGVYCGMGVCYDCLLVVDGVPSQRACVTEVRAGMRVNMQRGWALDRGGHAAPSTTRPRVASTPGCSEAHECPDGA